MSAEREALTFDEDVDADHDVDPEGVDWQAIFDAHAGSDGLLDMSTRADVVGAEVDGIENSRQAESLLKQAADAGCIEERGTDYYFDASAADEIDSTDVDWRAVFESVGKVGNRLPNSESKRNLGIKFELDLESVGEAERLVEDACDRGIIAHTEVNGTRGYYLSDALGEDDQSPTVQEVAPEPETVGGDRDETESDTESEESADSRPAPSEMPRSDLEQEVGELRKDMHAMQNRVDAMSSRMDTFVEAVFGDDSVPGDAEASEDLLTKFVDMRDRVDDHDEKLTMVSSGSASRKKPDERAEALRMALYEDAKADREKKAVMDRDQAKYALNGGLSRAQLLDAMRRAADGEKADIDGSSSLESMDGIEFVKGTGRDEQSRLRMILTQMSGEDLRKNLTTKQTGKGGQ